MPIIQTKCPDNTFKCNNDIKNIIGTHGTNIGLHGLEGQLSPDKCSDQFKYYGKNILINTCEKQYGDSQCNNCDYLFENLIKGETTCKDLYDKLHSMQKDEINTQIKYNLDQLIQMRLKINAIQNMPSFGTFEWWKLYIWGTNKIQNYIYILSFVICLSIVIYYLWNITLLSSKTKNPLYIIWALIIAIIIIILLFYYTFKSPVNYSIPVSSEFNNRYIEDDINRYQNNVRNNIIGKSPNGNLRYDPISSFAGFLTLTIVILLIIAFFIRNRTIKNIVLYILLGVIIAINVFYIFLIPQLLIVGIILQFIIIYWLNTNVNSILKWIIITILLLIMLGLSLFGIITDNKTHVMRDSCNDEMGAVSSLGFQYFFILVAIILVILSKYFKKSTPSSLSLENIPTALFHPIFSLIDELYQSSFSTIPILTI